LYSTASLYWWSLSCPGCIYSLYCWSLSFLSFFYSLLVGVSAVLCILPAAWVTSLGFIDSLYSQSFISSSNVWINLNNFEILILKEGHFDTDRVEQPMGNGCWCTLVANKIIMTKRKRKWTTIPSAFWPITCSE
jgi:hypothetical protein